MIGLPRFTGSARQHLLASHGHSPLFLMIRALLLSLHWCLLPTARQRTTSVYNADYTHPATTHDSNNRYSVTVWRLRNIP